MTISNAIFDMDGTLIDSMEYWRKYEIQIAEELLNMTFEDDFKKKISQLPHRFLVEEINKKANTLLDKKKHAILSAERISADYFSGFFKVKPGVREYLNFLKSKNIKMGIATATPRNLCEAYLEKVGLLSHFEVILTTNDDIKISKVNSPAIYDGVAEKLGAKKENTAVFEDLYMAIKTAKEAGYFTVGIKDDMQKSVEDKMNQICHVFTDNMLTLIDNPKILYKKD